MRLQQEFKKRKKYIFIGLVLLIALGMSSISYAEDEDGKPDVEMVNGNLVFDIKSTAASSSTNIRYRTTGFTISMKMQENMVTAKGTQGPDAPPTPTGHVSLSDAEKIELERTKEYVRTRFIIPEDKVKAAVWDAVGVDLDDLSEDTFIYLNATFETYQIINGNEVKYRTNVRTWRDIVNAHGWANPSVFERYFNIPVLFNPGPQDNDLYYELNGVSFKKGNLGKKPINTEIRWVDNVNPVENFDNTPCNLIGYYVKSKIDGTEIAGSRKMVGDKVGSKTITANDIINDSVKVLYGGMDIYMIYEPTLVNIVINAVDIDTNQIIKRDLYRGTVSPGEDFEKAIDSLITVDGVTYNKTKDFYYLYSDPANNLKKVRDETDTVSGPIKFQIPNNIKIPSTVSVGVYYKKTVPGTIPVTVKAINKDTGAEITTLATDAIAAGDTYNYTISEEPLLSSGKTYSYTGEWKWQYKKNTSSAPIMTNSGSGTEVSFKAPSADEIKDGITVNVYYKVSETQTDEISLRVLMVSKTGALIEEISSENVTRGQAISKPVQSSRSVNGTPYQYMDKWDYTYTSSSGDTTKTGSGATASFTVPSTTKLGTIITLKLYYDASQEIEVPDPAPPIGLPIDTPSPYAVINGDKYGANYFISKEGISTTESQHVYVKTKDYLLGYRLVNKTGKVTFTVPVTMTYTLQYFTATPEEFGGPEPVTDTVTDTQHISVERAYSYWEIESLEYYITSSANVYNYSLPDGKVNLSADNSYLDVPDLITWHSGRKEDHYLLPREHFEGIHLVSDITFTSDNDDRPTPEYQDLTGYALHMTGQLKVKNDYLVFNGSTVLSDTISEKITPYPFASPLVQSNKIIHDKVLYTEGQVIDALKRNGIYPSNGNVTYAKHPMSVNAYQNNKLFSMPVNDVTIHTPVICDPKIYSDNDKYVQLINPTKEAYHMVLDPDTGLNDFTVRISNKLPHSARLGYYERDFSRSFIDPENVSYIAKKEGVVRNEMKLPFDVYIDTLNDKNPENDEFIRAGTWIILGRETHRFYVPMWVQEGTYTAHFRTIAVNGEDRLANNETARNTNRNNYVATDTRTFQISGRMYGLTIYDISDEGRWKDVFRIKDTMMFKYFEGAEDGTKRSKFHDDYAYYYTVGINNQYGYQTGRTPRFTLPLLNGSHPKYKNVGVVKTGYAIRFMLDTVGEMYGSGCKVRLNPTFYHVDEKGKNRQQVDIYYDEEINNKQYNLVKIGQGIDLANIQQGLVGNPYSRIPEAELRHTARVMDTTYLKLKNWYGPMYSYSVFSVTSHFRTFIGLDYASHIVGLPSFTKVRNQINETELNLSKYMQRWYGTYKLPTNIHVVPSGYDVNGHLRKYGIDYHEDFWLKDGYIIVNFNIETIDKNGNRNLSYTNGYNYLNKGHCSMWVMEGGAVEKKDNTEAAFSLRAGDVVFYYTSKKHSDDYDGRIY